MSEREVSFGRRVVEAGCASDILALESSEGRVSLFEAIDAFLGDMLVRSLRGDRIVAASDGARRDEIRLEGLSADRQNTLADIYGPDRQHGRGAWYLPNDTTLTIGLANFPGYFRAQPRFAWGTALEECARATVKASADAICVWATIEPLFEQLFLPFALRGHFAGTNSPEDERKAWQTVDDYFQTLGLNVSVELAAMRGGSRWLGLSTAEQLEAKRRLLETIASKVSVETARRHRVFSLVALIQRYYAKAKGGVATRRQVLTRPFQRTLSTFFGGDWLAFVGYIGEAPHPDERIATALPKTKPFVSGRSRVKDVAAKQGLPVAEVERILATYWGESGVLSPVEQRVPVLRRFWAAFDEVHARQAPGMPPLWGFVEESGFITFDDVWRSPYQPGLYRKLLPADLVEDIDRLWGTLMLPQWPERIVSAPFPHAEMADALGPALKFWHGCALTAWFLSEGPYSRTDMAGLAEYHRAHLEDLKTLGCPIDGNVFQELQAAERKLGKPQPLYDNITTAEIRPGISFTMGMSRGSRRGGFERLRDIITRHRRGWSEKCLDTYLRARWESEIKRVAEDYHTIIADKGKPPTIKRFARLAVHTTNHWFGGDICGLYAALREKAPVQTVRDLVMPADRAGFAWSVFKALGGEPFNRKTVVTDRDEANEQADDQQRNHNLKRLAEEALWYVQLEEALGREPSLTEFGVSRFERPAHALSDEVEKAWRIYTKAIGKAKDAPTPPPESYRSAPVIAPPYPNRQRQRADNSTAPTSPAVSSEILKKPSWLDRLLGRQR